MLMRNMLERIDYHCADDKLGFIGSAPEQKHDRRKTARTSEERLDRTRERNRNAQRRYRERQKVRSPLAVSPLSRMY